MAPTSATVRRRHLLATGPNPGHAADYLVRLEGRIEGRAAGSTARAARVSLRYVPDRLVLDPAAFAAYLRETGGAEWSRLEELAVLLLDDLNSEVVPRWIRVEVSAADPGEAGLEAYSAVVEDHQPHWENAPLLAPLRAG